MQAISSKETPGVQSPLQIRHPTTTLRLKSIKTELQRGSAREVSSPSGTQMDSVMDPRETCVSKLGLATILIHFLRYSEFREKITMYVALHCLRL